MLSSLFLSNWLLLHILCIVFRKSGNADSIWMARNSIQLSVDIHEVIWMQAGAK